MIIFLVMSSTLYSQNLYEPSVVILSPNNIMIHKALKKQIDSLNNSISERLKKVDWKKREKLLKEEFIDEAENVRIMEIKKLTFMKNANYLSKISSISELYLQYKFFTKFENLMIYAVSDKIIFNDAKHLHAISEKYNSRYVLNFSELKLSQSNEGKTCSIDVQLYDSEKNEIVISKSFIGSDENPGFEFACESGSLACTFNNSLASALPEVAKVIYENSLKVKKEKNLLTFRNEILLNEYYLKPTDNLIRKVIRDKDSSLPLKNLYKGILNDEKNKLIGFFIIDTEGMSFKDLTKQKTKQKIEIISSSFGEIPSKMGFIVVGVKKDNTWILKKDKITYFDSSSILKARKQYFLILQTLNFFKLESIEVNPDFWDTDLFNFK